MTPLPHFLSEVSQFQLTFFNHHHYICAALETLSHYKIAIGVFIEVYTLLVPQFKSNSSSIVRCCPVRRYRKQIHGRVHDGEADRPRGPTIQIKGF